MAQPLEDFLDSKSDAELGKYMRDRYTRLADAHARGISDESPVARWNDDNRVLRAHRAATDTGQDPGSTPSIGDPNAEDDIPGADPSTAAHGGRSVRTLETSGSQRANASTVTAADSAQRLREMGLSERRIREVMTPNSASDADNRAAAQMIPSLGRLK